MLRRLLRATIAVLSTASLCIPLVASATSPLPSPPKPTCVMSSPPGAIAPGSTTRLIWYSEYAQGASISPGIGQVAIPTGYIDIHPSVSTLYTMTVTNASGSNTCGALVMIAVPNPPTLLTYYQPVYQPVVFTPITYGNVYVPYSGYGGYYVPYNSVVYNEWYDDYPARVYNQQSDFWSYYTRGPSTGPNLFQMMDGSRDRYGDSYVRYTSQTLPSGESRSISYDCEGGIGCKPSGMYSSSPVYTKEPEVTIEKLPEYRAPDADPISRPLILDLSGGKSEAELLAPPNFDKPGWRDSLPYSGSEYAQDFYRASVDYAEGSYGGAGGADIVPYSEASYYAEPGYYTQGSYEI